MVRLGTRPRRPAYAGVDMTDHTPTALERQLYEALSLCETEGWMTISRDEFDIVMNAYTAALVAGCDKIHATCKDNPDE